MLIEIPHGATHVNPDGVFYRHDGTQTFDMNGKPHKWLTGLDKIPPDVKHIHLHNVNGATVSEAGNYVQFAGPKLNWERDDSFTNPERGRELWHARSPLGVLTICRYALIGDTEATLNIPGHDPYSGPVDSLKEKAQILVDSNEDAIVQLQTRLFNWVVRCFGSEIAHDPVERNQRFLEEAVELAQSLNCTKSEALKVVEYVYSREAGDPYQEVGGAITTLMGLCAAHGISLSTAVRDEIARIHRPDLIDKIKAKNLAKPHFQPTE